MFRLLIKQAFLAYFFSHFLEAEPLFWFSSYVIYNKGLYSLLIVLNFNDFCNSLLFCNYSMICNKVIIIIIVINIIIIIVVVVLMNHTTFLKFII